MNAQIVVYAGFVLLPVAVTIALAWAARSLPFTFAIFVWMAIAAILARSGILNHFNSVPPPMALFILAGVLGTIVIGVSPWMRGLIKLPLGALAGFQAFRIVVEILMHKSATIGLAPPQMTWSGYNFDIVTGVTALLLAPFAGSAPRWFVFVWNCLGLTLLIVAVAIAALSFPTRFQLMQPDSTWVAYFPYVWLPAILVTAALLGHILVFRKLASSR